MIKYAKSILIPYFDKVRKEIGRSGRSKAYALAIFDVFKAHQNKDFISLLHKNRMFLLIQLRNFSRVIAP